MGQALHRPASAAQTWCISSPQPLLQAPAELGRVLPTLVQVLAGDSLVQAPVQALKAMRPKRVSGALRFLAMSLTCALYVEDLLTAVNAELFSPMLRPRSTGEEAASVP